MKIIRQFGYILIAKTMDDNRQQMKLPQNIRNYDRRSKSYNDKRLRMQVLYF